MARKRSIDPNSWTDEKLADADELTHLLWVGTVSLADDEGRLEWNERQIKFRLFPAKVGVTQERVAVSMAELVERGLIRPYEFGGRCYAYHPMWHRHQYVNRPTISALPDPPGVEKLYVRSPKGGAEVNTRYAGPRYSLGEPRGGLTDDRVKAPSAEQTALIDIGDVRSRKRAAASKANSPAIELAEWFVKTGLEMGALPAHERFDPHALAIRMAGDGDAANALLASYDRTEIETRARRFFALKVAGGFRRPVTLTTFLEAWTWREVEADPVLARTASDSAPRRGGIFGEIYTPRPEERL